MNTLPVEPAHRLAAQPEAQRWLVTDLWSEGAVGIVGGEPKCCKSFLALELAVAVASGRPALRRFAVTSPGRVLLYAAEDAQHIVRARLEGICAAVACELAAIDVQVITAPTLRLDLERDRERLERTVEALRSRLLILDPFVRLHRIDENSSGEVAPLLAYLRELQRRHALAVLLVHHARKSSGHVRAGQALRGSSEFHAWGDSNLYLRRTLTGHRRHYPGGIAGCTLRSLPQPSQPSPFCGRVGFHISPCEACTAFAYRCGLRACQVTYVTLCTEGFGRFVSSTTAPIATGRSESCRVRLPPTEEPRLSTAHHNPGTRKLSSSHSRHTAAATWIFTEPPL